MLGPRRQLTDSAAVGVTVRGEDGAGLPVDLSRLIRGKVTSEDRHTRQGKQTSLLMSTLRRETRQCPLAELSWDGGRDSCTW